MSGQLQETLSWAGVSRTPAPLAHPRVLSWAEIMFNRTSEEPPPFRSPQAEEAEGAQSRSVRRDEKWGLHLCGKAKQDSSLHVAVANTGAESWV